MGTDRPPPGRERPTASPNGHVAAVPSDGFYRLIVLSYIVAVAMPPVGAVLALVIGARRGDPRAKHWLGILAVCLVAGVMWTLIISSGALTATSAD
jgi:hypothetical protein